MYGAWHVYRGRSKHGTVLDPAEFRMIAQEVSESHILAFDAPWSCSTHTNPRLPTKESPAHVPVKVGLPRRHD